jgi:GTP:adenosylcobinamide-phosphate guanylyltransferase
MVNAVILAGTQALKGSGHDKSKALLPINGKLMVEYVVDALKGVDSVGKIAVVGPGKSLEQLLKDQVDAVIDSDGTIIENLTAGINYFGPERDLLICTSDIPLLTPESVSDFIVKSRGLKADFCYPIIHKRLNDEKYPEMERTYIKIREGLYTGGNIFYINPWVVEERLGLIEKLITARKNPLRMARLLSFKFMMQLSLGMVTIEKAEKIVSKIMNINVRAVISEYPEIGSDVDKPGDVVVAAAYLSK